MTQPPRTPSTYLGGASWCRSVMATLRLRPVTGIRRGSWVPNPRRTLSTRLRRRHCNGVGVPGRASGPLTTGICEHVIAGCHSAMGCLSQIEISRCHRPVQPAQTCTDPPADRMSPRHYSLHPPNPATGLPAAALQSYRKRYRSAYGHQRTAAGTPRPYVDGAVPGAIPPTHPTTVDSPRLDVPPRYNQSKYDE